MSGRDFGIQASWHEVFRKLSPDLDQTSLRQATSIAESINQQVEEFLNRYAATYTNDNGDFTFDASGSFTLNGDLTVVGTITAESGTIVAGDGDVTATMGPGTYFTTYLGYGLSTTTDGFVGGLLADDSADGVYLLGADGEGIKHNNSGDSYHTCDGDLYLQPGAGNDVIITGSGINELQLPHALVTAGSAAAGTPDIYGFGDSNTGLRLPGSDVIAFDTAGSQRWRIDASGNLLIGTSDDGFTAITGTYGSVQTVGSGAGGWEGYSINGRAVFMHDGGTATGIYDDVNNEWLFYGVANSHTIMYANGAAMYTVNSQQGYISRDAAGAGGYLNVGFRSVDSESTTPIAAGFSAHPSAKGIAPVIRSSNTAEKWVCRNNPDTGYIAIDASAFNISSHPSAKREIRRNEPVLDRLRQQEIIRFRREADAEPIVAFDPTVPGDEEAVKAMRLETATAAEWAYLNAQMNGPEFEEAGVNVLDWAQNFPEVCNWEADEDGTLRPIGINLGSFIATVAQALLELDERLSRPGL